MTAAAITEWVLFLGLSAVAIAGSALMIITMSMYRAGLLLMTSFVAIAGLFFLLNADLLALIQIMMNVGGMLVMIMFMVMLMMDPGGEMMWGMKRDMDMRGLGALSMAMPRDRPPADGAVDEHRQMMVDMAMSTTQMPWALRVGALVALALSALVIATPWPVVPYRVAADGTPAVGELMLTRYMMAFEGAAMLILAGIAAAVLLGKREPSSQGSAPGEMTSHMMSGMSPDATMPGHGAHSMPDNSMAQE